MNPYRLLFILSSGVSSLLTPTDYHISRVGVRSL